ncbi:glucose-1-phosphate cytidylyltransferase [bacterium]|nr:MAG: glucose-1-phosphate cytidylyltransferase [bacterium]
MKVVILCGGKGTRMGNAEIPKGLFPIGGKPVLWHVMNIYASYGFTNFVLCLGYKGDRIRDYFRKIRAWKIEFVDTGLNTNTGGRIKKVERLIQDNLFFATYGDGVADINLKQLLRAHNTQRRLATITVVRPYSPFGIVGVDSHTQMVTHFEEKPILDHWINGGFFVFNKEVFGYLKESDILEKHSFARLLQDKQLCAFKHTGFWKCMDTYKDNRELNEIWKHNNEAWIKRSG